MFPLCLASIWKDRQSLDYPVPGTVNPALKILPGATNPLCPPVSMTLVMVPTDLACLQTILQPPSEHLLCSSENCPYLNDPTIHRPFPLVWRSSYGSEWPSSSCDLPQSIGCTSSHGGYWFIYYYWAPRVIIAQRSPQGVWRLFTLVVKLVEFSYMQRIFSSSSIF